MNKYSILPLVMASLLIQGCGETVAETNNSLSTFLTVHDKYCAAEYSSAEQLISALQNDPELVISDAYDGIFEKNVSSVSYAVSPEEGGCTTDLKIKVSSDAKPYFSFEDMNSALLTKGYKAKGQRKIRSEMGLDNSELKVLEQQYESKNNVISTLVFPLENEDQYYMTLFVEKFEIQDASFKVSSPDLIEI